MKPLCTDISMALKPSNGRKCIAMNGEVKDVSPEFQEDPEMDEIVEKLNNFHISKPTNSRKRLEADIEEISNRLEKIHLSDDQSDDIDVIITKLKNVHITDDKDEKNDVEINGIVKRLRNVHISDEVNEGDDENKPVPSQSTSGQSQLPSSTDVREKCFSLWKDASCSPRSGATTRTFNQPRQDEAGDATVDGGEIKLWSAFGIQKEDQVRPRSDRLTRRRHDDYSVFLTFEKMERLHKKTSPVDADFLNIIDMLENLHVVGESNQKSESGNSESTCQTKNPALYRNSGDTEVNELKNRHPCRSRRAGSNLYTC